MSTRGLFIALLAGAVLFSCNNITSQNQAPIVLGDSSTIVTEKDPQKLKDLVTDLKPQIPTTENKDTVATIQTTAAPKAPDTIKKNTVAVIQKPQANISVQGGLTVDFNIASLVIANVTAKQAGKPDLSRANGAVYTWISGAINGTLLKVTANVTRVSQRYQSVVVIKNDDAILPLESLSTTTQWEPLKGSDNVYKVTGLDEKSLEAPVANRNSIRNAVQKATRRRRMSYRKKNEWEESVRNARSVDEQPFHMTLRSVMWKIDGKDANGKVFSKQIRIDFPL